MTTESRRADAPIATRRLTDVLPPWPLLAAALATATVAVALLPAVRFDGWRWSVVVAAGFVCVGLAAPAHVTALRTLLTLRPGPHVVASVGVLAAWGWSVVAAAGGSTGGGAPLLAGMVPGALLVASEHVRRRAGVDPAGLAAPRWWLPAVFGVAVLAAVVWGAAESPARGGATALAVLLAAAPTALLLAVPVAMTTSRSRAAARGVRLGDVAALDAAADADTVVLDQDGTVTTGNLRVISIDPVEPEHDRNLRWFAGALSHAGDHPISRAVSRLSARGRLTSPEHVAGRGMQGSVDRHAVRVGAPEWLGVLSEPDLWRTVAVEVDGKVIGTLSVAEDLRTDAEEHVRGLLAAGFAVHLVSPSTPPRAAHVAGAVGLSGPSGTSVDQVVSSLTAEGHRVVVASGHPVAVPGAVSLAPGAELSGGIGLDDPDVANVRGALDLATATRSGVRRARGVALVVSVGGALAAAAGLLSPDLAAATSVAAAALTTTFALR